MCVHIYIYIYISQYNNPKTNLANIAETFLKLWNFYFLAALFLLLALSHYSHDSFNVRLEYAIQCVGPGESGKAGAQGQLTAIMTPMFKNTQGIRVRVKRVMS